jgi:hypothetical protein
MWEITHREHAGPPRRSDGFQPAMEVPPSSSAQANRRCGRLTLALIAQVPRPASARVRPTGHSICSQLINEH